MKDGRPEAGGTTQAFDKGDEQSDSQTDMDGGGVRAGRLGGVGAGPPGGDQRHRGLDVQRRRQRGLDRRVADPGRPEGRVLLGRPPRLQPVAQRPSSGSCSTRRRRTSRPRASSTGAIPQTVYNYHGYFAYNFGDTDAAARPYILGGLGATQYGSLDTALGEIGGETQFSSTWAVGLKIFPSPKFGLRLETRWTPTYIKTDPEGYWCDPYWGCYTVGEAEFSNQFELSGGIILRF